MTNRKTILESARELHHSGVKAKDAIAGAAPICFEVALRAFADICSYVHERLTKKPR
jgi:hypothetical protein